MDHKSAEFQAWESMSPAEKKLELFRRQKDLLDTFLSTGAISQAQHDKSLSCLVGEDGNAFAILGRCRAAMRKAGYPQAFIDTFVTEVTGAIMTISWQR